MPAIAPPAPAAKPAASPAPTPAPAAKPAASPVAAAEKPTERDPGDWMGEAGADLDALDAEETARSEGRKPSERKPEKAPVKPAEKPAAQPPAKEEGAQSKPPEGGEPPPEPKGLIETRNAYQSIKKKVKEEYEPQIQRLESRIKELESVNPNESKALQQRLEAAEKRRDELEGEIKFVNFSKSSEYIENYQKPYQKAWERALRDLGELQVEEANGQTRPAEEKDLVKLANMTLGEARRQANAMFGDSADDVMRHRAKIIELADAQEQALEKARTDAQQHAQTSQAQMQAMREKKDKLFDEATAAIETRWPKTFGRVEGDEKGNALLDKGDGDWDRLTNPNSPNKPKTLEEMVRFHAMIRHKIRNHDRLYFWVKNLSKENADLKASLEAYEKSEPNGGLGGRNGAGGGGTADPWSEANNELDEMDRKGS